MLMLTDHRRLCYCAVLSGLADTDNGRFMSMGTSVFSSTVDTNLMRHLGTEMDDMGPDDDDDDNEPVQQTVSDLPLPPSPFE
jgi:hypothetical protein